LADVIAVKSTAAGKVVPYEEKPAVDQKEVDDILKNSN